MVAYGDEDTTRTCAYTRLCVHTCALGAVFEPRQPDARALAVVRKRWEASHTPDDKGWRSLLPVFAKITREVVHRGPFVLLLPRQDNMATDPQNHFLLALLKQTTGGMERSSIESQTRKSTEL